MSSIVSDDLSRWFIQYWEFSEREADQVAGLPRPVVGLQRYWPDWWDLLAISEQLEIQRLADASNRDRIGQESFVKWLGAWIDGKGYPRGSFRVVLAQLAQVSLFRSWQSLDSFRLGANALVLQQAKGHSSPDDVKPLIGIAVLEQTEPDERYHAINLEITEGLAKSALSAAFHASLSALRGFVFCRFLFWWIVFGRKSSDSTIRKVLRIMWMFSGLGWAVVAILLFLLPTTDLFSYFPDDELLVPGLLVLVLIPFLGLLYALIVNGREALLAWSQGQVWARRLKRSRFYLIDGNQRIDTPLNVIGQSFGLMLPFCNLLALYGAEEPGEQSSWLWREFFSELTQKLPRLSGTGEITGRGGTRRVERFEDKWEASRAHPMITEMIAPFQKETLLHWGSSSKATLASATGEGHASGAGRIKLRHCSHLSWAMLTAGNLVNLRSVVGSLLMLVVSVIACAAASDVISIADTSAPQLLDYQVIIPDPECHPAERFWLLTFHTDRPDVLEVYDHYHHRTAKLTRSAKNPEQAVALIELADQQPVQGTRVAIELRQHRSLLGFRLPDKTVLLQTLL